MKPPSPSQNASKELIALYKHCTKRKRMSGITYVWYSSELFAIRYNDEDIMRITTDYAQLMGNIKDALTRHRIENFLLPPYLIKVTEDKVYLICDTQKWTLQEYCEGFKLPHKFPNAYLQ